VTKKKTAKPAKNHPWRAWSDGKPVREPNQREAENRNVPHHANPLRRKF
jgi:hypothetical protein